MTMAAVDGAYDCVAKTPLGEQKGVLTVISSGDSFHGTFAGMMGSLDVAEGKVDGNKLTWKMNDAAWRIRSGRLHRHQASLTGLFPGVRWNSRIECMNEIARKTRS
jgi:hypothetical protein